jgi:hypothetical protein
MYCPFDDMLKAMMPSSCGGGSFWQAVRNMQLIMYKLILSML